MRFHLQGIIIRLPEARRYSVIHSQKEQQWNRIRVQFGDVNVADYVYMYKKLQFHNHQNLGYEELRTPLTKDYDTEGTWSICRRIWYGRIVVCCRRMIRDG